MSPSPQRETSFGVFLQALVSLLAALGLVFGIPLALILFVGWPLPTEVPSWASFTESLEQQGITYQVLVNALAVIVWLAWAPLAWAIAVEAVAAARGRAARRVHAWPGAQYVARRLVASAALLASSLGGMRGAIAEPLDPLLVTNADTLSAAEAESPPDLAAVSTWHAGETVTVPEPAGSVEELRSRAGGPSASVGQPEPEPAVVASSGDAPAGGVSTYTAPVQAAPATADPADEAAQVHVVERGDTFWGLAERYLGSGMRWREIRDHNVGRAVGPGRVLAATEDHLEAGWRLEIPGQVAVAAGVVTGAGPGGAPAPPEGDTEPAQANGSPVSEARAGQGGPEAGSVGVQPGDHFWALAERQLEEAWGRPVTAEEVAPYWQQMVAANLDGLISGNPDLVYPGEQFTAPAAPPAPGGSVTATEAPPADPPEDAPDAQAPEPAEEPAPAGSLTEPPQREGSTASEAGDASVSEGAVSSSSAEAVAGPEEDEGGSGAEAGEAVDDSALDGAAPASPEQGDVLSSSGQELDTGVPAADVADDDLAGDDDSERSFDIPVAVPFGASAALAGLLLLALGRRRLARRRLLRPGVVVEPRPEEDARLERELAVGSRDVLDTVAAASRGYGAVLATRPDLPLVTGLVVTPALDVMLHLAEPAEPLVPFERGPASDRWDLYLDELDLDPEFGPGPEPSESVLDTPAVIGRTDEGDWVVVDLESLGALEIDGAPDMAADLVRSIVAELALQPQAERMVDITVVGVDGLSPEVLEQGVVVFDHLDEDLVRRVERVAAETDAVQAHRGAAARAQGMPRDGLFVTVVALGGRTPPDPMLLERLASAATPGGRGVAVIAVGAVGSGATRVLVDQSGLAHIPHMGMTVEAVRLAPESLQRIEQLLANEPEGYRLATEGDVSTSWPEWKPWSAEDTEDAAWMGSWLSSDLAEAVGDEEVPGFGQGDAAPGGGATDPQPLVDASGEAAPGAANGMPVAGPGGEPVTERAAHEMDTAEVEGLDDMAPATPDLHAVPPPEVGPEPLSVRDEPHWPDPGVPAGPDEASSTADPGIPPYQSPEWEYCIRIFADHVVENAEGQDVSFRYGDNPNVPNKNTHRGPELLAYLALSGRSATAEEVRDHMWWDRPVALGTVNKLLYGTRKVLGGAGLLSHAQEDPLGRYRLAPTVVTDVQLLNQALDYARTVANRSPDAAVDVLRAHLQAIEAVAFRNGQLGQGLMEWAAAYRIVDAVEQPVVEAALLMSRLSCERGRSGYFDALWAIDQGLRACPYNEALVRMAMEIEALLGNTDAVNHRYLTLATRLARDELEPEPETSELRARLGGTFRLRSAG